MNIYSQQMMVLPQRAKYNMASNSKLKANPLHQDGQALRSEPEFQYQNNVSFGMSLKTFGASKSVDIAPQILENYVLGLKVGAGGGKRAKMFVQYMLEHKYEPSSKIKQTLYKLFNELSPVEEIGNEVNMNHILITYSQDKFGKEEKLLLEKIDPHGFEIDMIRNYCELCKANGVKSKITDEELDKIMKDVLDTDLHYSNLLRLLYYGKFEQLEKELYEVNPLLLSREGQTIYQYCMKNLFLHQIEVLNDAPPK